MKATVGALSGTARVRVIEAPPWTFDFENAAAEAPPAWWVGAPTKVVQRTVEGVGKVLVRPRDETVGRRAKVFFGQPNLTGFTVEADVRGREQRRQRGDVGLDQRALRPGAVRQRPEARAASVAGGRRNDRRACRSRGTPTSGTA